MSTALPMPDTPSVTELVAEEVRALLARRRISANAARKKLGWTQSYMSRRTAGVVPFDVEDLAQLAELLDVSITDLLPDPSPRGRRGGVDTGVDTQGYPRPSSSGHDQLAQVLPFPVRYRPGSTVSDHLPARAGDTSVGTLLLLGSECADSA